MTSLGQAQACSNCLPTHFIPTDKISRRIQSEQVLDTFIQIVRRDLPLEMKNTRISADDVIYALTYASAHRMSMEAAYQELAGAPSSNCLREVLAGALPERVRLQRSINTIFRRQLPKCLLKGKQSYNIAIDVTLIPYHGRAYQDEKEIVRGEPKSGTTHFHGCTTVSIVHNNRRYVVALHFISYGETMAEIVRWLLKRLKALKICVRRVFLPAPVPQAQVDKGFCSKPFFKVLDCRKLSYVLPIPVRGRSSGGRRLFQGKSGKTTYTFHSPTVGEYTVQAVVVQRYSKGRYGRHGSKWFAYAVSELPTGTSPAQIFELYRQRFGIETSYRQMNQVRARTTTRNPAVRLLLVGLAFILFNCRPTSSSFCPFVIY